VITPPLYRSLAAMAITAAILALGCGRSLLKFRVTSESMSPTLVPGQLLVVTPLTADRAAMKRFQIIVFHPPALPSQVFAMRVLGLPGETLTITNDSLIIDGRLVTQRTLPTPLRHRPWLPANASTNSMQRCLAKDELFVVGDNLQRASDSRSWGPIKLESVIGLVSEVKNGISGWTDSPISADPGR
jgi:signal peptidase I